METALNTKSFLIYFVPPKEISDLLEQVSLKLRQNHPSNTYVPLYNGKWHSHLMIYLSPMPTLNQENIIEKVKFVASKIKPFTVVLNNVEAADANYLYVNVNANARAMLEDVREKLVNTLAPYRDSTIKEKYLAKWETFTEDEKHRIRTSGLPYRYVPHMTLGVFVSKEESEEACNEVANLGLTGKSFEANQIEILTSIGSDYRDKEIIFSQKLKL